jgi:hypothetical protein
MHALQRLRFVAERYTRLQDLPISPLAIPFVRTDVTADRQSIARMDLLTGPSLASRLSLILHRVAVCSGRAAVRGFI